MPISNRVFISHHDSDAALVERLAGDLKSRGISCWRAAVDVPEGSETHWAIKDAIQNSHCFVACLSPAYLTEDVLRTQLFLARAYAKPILPILVAAFSADRSPRFDLIDAGNTFTHALRGLEELDIADFSGRYPGWGLGSYERNFERLVDVVQPMPRPKPLSSELIYVSYDYGETEFATRLARDLELARGHVWIDKLSIKLGSNWRQSMYEGLRSAARLIVCLTPEAARSENVNHEVLFAAMRRIQILPVLTESVAADPQKKAELDRALRASREMSDLTGIQPYRPRPTYQAMLDNLKKNTGLSQPEEARRDGIFISYRRADSQAVTGRIHERLVEAFGAETVFRDVDTIPAGKDFADYYRTWLARKAAVMLVIIGKTWNGGAPADGQAASRILQERDHVRIEVETALSQRGLVVIPVLVDEAKLPEPAALPDSLQQLRGLNGSKVRHDPDFDRDMQRLIAAIRESQG